MPTDNYQIRLLKIAEDDFTEIISYIAVDNSNAADALISLRTNLETQRAGIADPFERGGTQRKGRRH